MTAVKQDRGYKLKAAPPSFLICGLLFLFLATGAADARRRHFRARYAPPSSSMAIDLYTGRILNSKNANQAPLSGLADESHDALPSFRRAARWQAHHAVRIEGFRSRGLAIADEARFRGRHHQR